MNDISHAVSFLRDGVKACKDGRLYTARQLCHIAGVEIDELIRHRRRREDEMAYEMEPPTPSGPPEGPDI